MLEEPGCKGEVTFKRYFQFCRSTFKRKEGRKVVTRNKERGAKGLEDNFFFCWKCCRRATERLQEYGNLESLEIKLRQGRRNRENENFTIFLKEAAAIDSKFTTYTQRERQKGWLMKKRKLVLLNQEHKTCI